MQNFSNGNNKHVTWREADKSWLKAKGRSVRSILDSVQREDGIGRYVVAGVSTIVIASAVGLSGVFAATDLPSKALTSSLNPLGIIESITGSPGSASAQALEECGEVAADTSIESDGSGAGIDISFDPANIAPPAPEDFVIVPPVLIGDDSDDPTGEPPVDEPPTNEPPTNEPPAADSEDNLIGADLNLLGEDVADIGILSGGLLGVGVDSLDPSGTGTGTGIGVDLQDDDLVNVGADPQDDGVVDVNVQGEDVLDGTSGDDVLGGVTGGDPLGDLLGDDPLGGILGDDPLGGLLN